MVSLAWIAKTKKQSPSEILNIADELTAFEFDAAACFAEKEFEEKRDIERIDYFILKLKIMVNELFTGKPATALTEQESEEW